MSTPPIHTPGPWKYTSIDGLIWGDDEDSRNGYPIADISAYKYQHRAAQTSHANGRLIAAAPELLAALKNLLAAHHCADETGYVADVGFLDMDAIEKAADDAIAEAEGGAEP